MKKYFLAVPYEILAIEELKLSSKLVLALILNLSQLENGCYASNAFFAEKLSMCSNTVCNSVSELKKSGYINVKIINGNTRYIYPNHNKICVPSSPKHGNPLHKTWEGRSPKIGNNNINIKDNKRDNIYNYYNEIDFLEEKRGSSFDIDELEKIV